MRREEFVASNVRAWDRLESLLLHLESRRRRGIRALELSERPPDPAEFDALYRQTCRHLALARQRRYGDDLVARLNDLALRSYRQLYGVRPGLASGLAALVFRTIPATVRAHGMAVAIAGAAFLLPFASIIGAVLQEPSIARAVLPGDDLRHYERMYDPSSTHYARDRESDGNLHMFGFYIWNNVGIAFRTFGWGLPGGVGSLFVLVFNGLVLGTTTAHVAARGYGETFFPFVAGHTPFEFSGIVLSGAAGLQLGWALLAPGRLTRAESLRRAGRDGAVMMGGAFLLLILAAFIEAYWSPRHSIPAAGRYVFGGCMTLLLASWILRAPRLGA
jgi:uncharacterized membrane protein SpoIIM required for sporulation